MILIVFGAILLVAIMVALLNWRHGWFAAMVCGVLQDPFRKMTPGTPAAMTMSVVLVYGVIIIAAAATLHRNRRDFALRFPNVYSAVSVVIIFPMRARVLTKAWPWIIVTGWAFLNCIISGRRKAVYMVLAFALAFFWRYFKRLSIAQLSTILAIGLALMGVVYFVGGSEKSSVYTKGTRTSSAEVFERLEGGTFGSIEQHGIFGAGLGAATQGVRHVIGTETDLGWQEGGMGK